MLDLAHRYAIVVIVYAGGQKMKKTTHSKETSSKKLGTLASKVLKDPKSSKKEKSLAGSVLTQRPDKKKK